MAQCGTDCGCGDPFDKAFRGGIPVVPQRQAFNVAADATLARCQQIHAQRGSEYADTWALENVHAPVLKLALRETFGFDATAEELRLIMAASLCDVKDSRLIGEWKPDNMDDGINYRGAFTQWMIEYKQNHDG